MNHKYKGIKTNNSVTITGSYDINIWYSYDNDTKTDVVKKTFNYEELVNIREKDDIDYQDTSIIVRSLKEPSCKEVKIDNNKINYIVSEELGIELIGDTKVKILVSDDMDEYEDIIDSKEVLDDIDKNVNENYLEKEN